MPDDPMTTETAAMFLRQRDEAEAKAARYRDGWLLRGRQLNEAIETAARLRAALLDIKELCDSENTDEGVRLAVTTTVSAALSDQQATPDQPGER